jgi:hypothetical protein
MNRKFVQPHRLLPDFYRGTAIQIEAMAQASSVDELFARLESEGVVVRIDSSVVPTMFRGAVVSDSELRLLRQIKDVVRLGHVRRIERDEIVLDGGRVASDPQTLYVHCAARGLASRPLRPIFEPARVTIQPFFWGFACYQFALLGVIEATVESDEQKNQFCPPVKYWDKNEDYLSAFLAMLIGDRLRVTHPALASWIKGSRLNPISGIRSQLGDPRVIDSRERIKRFGAAAVENLQKLLSER